MLRRIELRRILEFRICFLVVIPEVSYLVPVTRGKSLLRNFSLFWEGVHWKSVRRDLREDFTSRGKEEEEEDAERRTWLRFWLHTPNVQYNELIRMRSIVLTYLVRERIESAKFSEMSAEQNRSD